MSHWLQAAKLYTELGQFNPNAARAQRRQAKKYRVRRISTKTQASAWDDFDFKEAFSNVDLQ
jgi:hypothetical protein